MHILIAGGSGFLGRYLARHLAKKGQEVTILSRRPESVDAQNGIKVAYWDGISVQLPPQDKPIDAVINLCGLSIARFWSPKAKQAITDSRIQPSQALANWIRSSDKKPQVMIQISGIDYYDMLSEKCQESDPNGHGFLAKLAQEWENTTQPLQKTPTRLVIARLAPVLAKTHPPLKPLSISTKLYAGAMIGDGKQYFSWIHHDDFTGIMEKMLTDHTYSGTYNVCAPHPIPYSTFMQTLANIHKRPLWLKIPSWMMQKSLGEMATLITDSRKVYPQKLQKTYTFQFPTIEQALENIYEKSSS